MKEEDRLAAVVARIDEEVGVVPRGAYMKTPLGEVVLNKSFQGRCFFLTSIILYHDPRDKSVNSLFMIAGLVLGEAKRLNYYFHFRPIPADNDENKKVLYYYYTVTVLYLNNFMTIKIPFIQGITEAIDFLTPIDKDIPKG